MPYSALAFISVLVFTLVHLNAERIKSLSFISQSRFLSAGGGVAIAYVFIDLLPKLAKSDLLVRHALSGVFPYFERHVYILALIGFLLFFTVDRSAIFSKRGYWLSIGSYALFNFLVGYAVVNKDNPEVRPLVLFTFAIALHYFTNDYSLSKEHGQEYQKYGRWLIVVALFLGWFTGLWITLSPTAIALVSAFIGGGVIMNVTRHELPKDNPNSLGSFLLFALVYTIILLGIG
jgi:hypothetical protein